MNRYHKNPECNKKGFYILEHMPTGKLWTGIAKKSMKDDIESILTQLKTGQFENLELQKLYDKEAVFIVHFHACTHIDDAKQRERTFRGSRQAYLFVNKSDTRKRAQRSERAMKHMVDDRW